MRVQPLPARIAAELSAEIVAGDMPAGAHLSTQALASRFSVSRSPIRSALRLLEKRGAVRRTANRGYFVNHLTAKARAGIERSSAGRRVAPDAYYALAEDWLRDAVPEDVTERMLLDRYSIGRSELSAILNRAASEGWIERKPGYGWRLLPVAKTAEAQAQLYGMRQLLEPAAFLEPTFELDRAVAEQLKTDLERVRDGAHSTWTADRLHGLGVSFHEHLMMMSGNPFLFQAVQRVNRMRRLLEYRSMIDRRRILEETREHLEILEPLMRGDLVETSFLMRRHVARALARKRTGGAAIKGGCILPR